MTTTARVGIALIVVASAGVGMLVRGSGSPRAAPTAVAPVTERTQTRLRGRAASNQSLRALILRAYELQDAQLIGGPDWMESEDVRAWPRDRSDLKARLVAHFGLRMHSETRELPVHTLVIESTSGRGLRRAIGDCTDAVSDAPGEDIAAKPGRPLCGVEIRTGPRGRTVVFRAMSMSEMAKALSWRAGTVVTDGTGLQGKFDAELEISNTPEAQTAGLLVALREQAGLELKPGRASVQVFVVDSVARPMDADLVDGGNKGGQR